MTSPLPELIQFAGRFSGEVDRRGDLEFCQGTVLAWNADAGTNQIFLKGGTVNDIPVISSAGQIVLAPGDNVTMFRFKSTFWIMGKVFAPGSEFAQPQWPIVLYPQFRPNGTAGTTGNWTVNAGVLASWEGRVFPTLPKIAVDGVWGHASGSGNVTYELLLGGTSYGSWLTTGGADVSVKGPFDVSARLGQDWLKIEVKITASTGTGEVFFQPLGCYFRQT